MLDFLYWFIGIFFNIFSTLDSIIIVGNLSLLKLFIILGLFTFILNILIKKGEK